MKPPAGTRQGIYKLLVDSYEKSWVDRQQEIANAPNDNIRRILLSIYNHQLKIDMVGWIENDIGYCFVIKTPWVLDPVFWPKDQTCSNIPLELHYIVNPGNKAIKERWVTCNFKGEDYSGMTRIDTTVGTYFVDWGTSLVKNYTNESAEAIGTLWSARLNDDVTYWLNRKIELR